MQEGVVGMVPVKVQVVLGVVGTVNKRLIQHNVHIHQTQQVPLEVVEVEALTEPREEMD
jgi:hypothetical protein